MTSPNLNEMINGWFVGDFSPSVLKTQNCEVAVKRYDKGDSEASHHHKIATEVTLVMSGSVRMMGRDWHEGDIVVIEPGKSTSFEALDDAVCVVVKVPGAQNDKYVD